MRIDQTTRFKKQVKKLHVNQKKDLDVAIHNIISNPELGEQKKGVLKNVRVYKFKMQKQLTLCAYCVPSSQKIILLSVSSHENFYTGLENYVL